MKQCFLKHLLLGWAVLFLSAPLAQAAQCQQKSQAAHLSTAKPVIYRFARPIRFHTAYYCPDNGMYYPQTLGCMSPWVVTQR